MSLQDPPWCLKSLFRVHSGGFLSYSRKRKISQNDHSLPFVVICCHSLSFVVTRCHSLSFVVIHCLSLYYSLAFVVTRCTTHCHSLSVDESIVYLFINDRPIGKLWSRKKKSFLKFSGIAAREKTNRSICKIRRVE